jgi:ribosomal protein L11 methyltransferase
MREVVLRVPKFAVEDVLDRLLPIVPDGVRERERGRHVELSMRGEQLPSLAEVGRAAGRWPHRISEHQVPDDWRERRIVDYEPDPIANRLIVRPDWAPAAPANTNMIEIALSEAAAFGAGAHPTTRTCLELLLGLEPAGSFADLGCGTGVLAILAAKLGWAPVTALDINPESVRATAENAAANGVVIEANVADLSIDPPPQADGIAANVPAALHVLLAAALVEPLPRTALLSGFGPPEADATLKAYTARGFVERRRLDEHRWVIAHVTRD